MNKVCLAKIGGVLRLRLNPVPLAWEPNVLPTEQPRLLPISTASKELPLIICVYTDKSKKAKKERLLISQAKNYKAL